MGEEVHMSFYEQRTAADAAYRQKLADSGRPATQWHREAEVWFDGSVESVDRRIAMCDRLLATSRRSLAEEGFTAKHLAAVDGLDRQRGALEDLRHQLLTAGADREELLERGRELQATLRPQDRRWVELEATRFARDNQGATRDELLVRAKDHAELHTSTYAATRSRAIAAAFAREVDRRYHPALRTASVERPTPDCADEMMFM
jgi:hypothetical protein